MISPLLANVYLHLLDRNFRLRVQRGDLQGRLVRYADDFVLLSPQRPDRALAWLQQLMTRLGLALHPDKTRVLDVRHDDFVFLGHTHRRRFNRLYLNVSPRALARIREELRRKTRQTWLSLDAMVGELNPWHRTGHRTVCRLHAHALMAVPALRRAHAPRPRLTARQLFLELLLAPDRVLPLIDTYLRAKVSAR